MAEVTRLSVPEESDGERLDRFLANSLPQYSREYLKKLIQKDAVLSESGKVLSKPSIIMKEGDLFSITIPDVVPLALEPEDLAIDILFEDESLLVVNKPSGMLTHPTGRTQTGTLVNAILFHCKDRLSSINGVERPGIVHRLDRDTAGLLMIAKTDEMHRLLQKGIQSREIKREYRAIVQGVFSQASGVVEAFIGRHPKRRDSMAVCQENEGRYALTHWRLVENYHNRFALLELSLQTGRTHQIRVHMAHIGHPLVGDVLYGTGLENQVQAFSQGQVLQSFRLTFEHPLTGEKHCFELPQDDKIQRALDYFYQM